MQVIWSKAVLGTELYVNIKCLHQLMDLNLYYNAFETAYYKSWMSTPDGRTWTRRHQREARFIYIFTHVLDVIHHY